VITTGDEVLAESGMIVDVLARRAGSDLAVDFDSSDYPAYAHWLHFAEGSAMPPFLLALYTRRLGDAAAPLQPRIQSEILNHMSYLESELAGKEWLVGGRLTGADIMMSFIGEIAMGQGMGAMLPGVAAWVARIHARPQWQSALEKGGPYVYA
jgi:glutathione S-transferase